MANKKVTTGTVRKPVGGAKVPVSAERSNSSRTKQTGMGVNRAGNGHLTAKLEG